eukprot:scaffold517_cov255-Pinguiococcus_pyrenoidosus.AAC.3
MEPIRIPHLRLVKQLIITSSPLLGTESRSCSNFMLRSLRFARASLARPVWRSLSMARELQVEAWYFEDDGKDQRLPHKYEPNREVSLDKLSQLGVLQWALDADNYKSDPELQKIRDDRGYSYEDIIEVSPDTLPGYDDKIRTFFEEHIHTDEEIRYVLDGERRDAGVKRGEEYRANAVLLRGLVAKDPGTSTGHVPSLHARRHQLHQGHASLRGRSDLDAIQPSAGRKSLPGEVCEGVPDSPSRGTTPAESISPHQGAWYLRCAFGFPMPKGKEAEASEENVAPVENGTAQPPPEKRQKLAEEPGAKTEA